MSAVALLRPDPDGRFHVLALSGGKDSTALALELRDREPRVYNYVCTPTGDEPEAMFAHWRDLGERLGSRIIPVVATWTGKQSGNIESGLDALIDREGTVPNRRLRFCTRVLKIEPYRAFLLEATGLAPVVSYVGLRADEEGRAGGAFNDIPGVEMRFPLREWGYDEARVLAELDHRRVSIPIRTDCRKCYAQQIGEWYLLWLEDRQEFENAIRIEKDRGATFREPKFDDKGWPVVVSRYGHTYFASSRDTWPAHLEDLGIIFASGVIPPTAKVQRDLFRSGDCRVCAM